MDFLEIRRKAKERAAARAAAAAAVSSAGSASPGPPSDPVATLAPAPPARRPLALEPLPLRAQAPISISPLPDPEEPRTPPPPPVEEEAVAEQEPAAARGETDAEVAARAAEAAAEAARLEAELELRLRDMPVAPDVRFRSWRPSGGAGTDLPAIAPGPEPEEEAPAEPTRRDERRQAGPGARRRADPAVAPHLPAGDPLDEFFYQEGEPGPELGLLSAPLEAAALPVELVERVEYLTFLLGAEEYGVEIDRVREVMRSPPITEVPRAPSDVLGVITVRGEVVAVFDPRGRLGLPRAGLSEGGRVIIVDDGAGPCGLLVDAVANVVRLPRGSIEARPQGIGGTSADCLEGIGRDRDRLFTVLSVSALLKPGRRVEGRS